jgi:hypothetical protein
MASGSVLGASGCRASDEQDRESRCLIASVLRQRGGRRGAGQRTFFFEFNRVVARKRRDRAAVGQLASSPLITVPRPIMGGQRHERHGR